MRFFILRLLSFILMLPAAPLGKASDEVLDDKPVPVNKDERYEFSILAQSAYTDQEGRSVIDIIEGYQVNMALSVETAKGQPVIGLQPQFAVNGTSQLIPPGESTPLSSTDESGIVEFGLTAGQPGMDQLTVSFGANAATVYLNIISLQIKDFAVPKDFGGGLSWNELMRTKLEFVDGELKIDFPEILQQQDGESVRVSGFMMPLDAGLKQQHFLLTSAPPHCFFHIPGGPAGVIEVFAAEGIEPSWEPVSIEGQFQLVRSPTMGVIYQLQNAVVVD